MKKISLLLLVLSLILCGCGDNDTNTTEIPANSEPLYYIENEEFGYIVYEDHVELKEFFGSASETVEIPEMFYDSEAKKDKPLTAIGNTAFNQNSGTRYLTIPDSVTKIGTGAFINCVGLEKVTLSQNLKTIGSSAFAECSGLLEITIPDSVEFIGDSAFERCATAKSLNLGNGVTEIGERAFAGCVSLESVSGGSKLKIAGSDAFEKTPWLNSLSNKFDGIGTVLIKYSGNDSEITIPDSFTSVSNAFEDNLTISSVSFPQSFEVIGNNSFAGCSVLSDVSIPETVTYIGHSAFEDTPYLENLSSEDGYCIVGDGILLKYSGNETGLKIPDEVKFISDAFCNNPTVSEIRIGDNVKTISRDAFSNCPKLCIIFMSESVTHIDEYAFDGTQILEFYTSGNTYTEEWATNYGFTNIITD